LCREHGLQLSELAAENKLEGFGLFGVIKETGVVSLQQYKRFVFVRFCCVGIRLSANIFRFVDGHFLVLCLQDDQGLADFYNKYFKYPLYRDVNLDFYRALGDGKFTDPWTWSTMLNPFKVAREVTQLGKRLKDKGIEGNYVGEGIKTGGIIIFDNNMKPKYMYKEVPGRELELDDILAAVNSMRGGASVKPANDTDGSEL
jgi:hypothetical protein